MVLGLAACGSTNHAPTSTVRAIDADNWGCFKSQLDSAGRCPYNPDYDKAHTRRTRAGELAVAKAVERARAERARAVAAARAQKGWSAGFVRQDANVYWRSKPGCRGSSGHGCWHVEVTTRDGCPSYIAVQANEYREGAVVNSLRDVYGYSIAPKTPMVFELEADVSGARLADVHVDCK